MPPAIYQPSSRTEAVIIGENLKRLQIERGWTLEELASNTDLNVKTILDLKKGRKKPHPGTITKVAAAFKVPVSELIDEKLSEEELFDRRTNPAAAEFVDANRRLFRGWTREEYAEFFSRFGVGGQQTEEGARASAVFINERRAFFRKVSFLLETPSADMLWSMVDQMWKRERLTE